MDTKLNRTTTLAPQSKSTDGLKLRDIGTEQQESFSDLVNECFGYDDAHRFLTDFPVWDSRLNPHIERLGFFRDGMLIGAIAGRLAYLKGVKHSVAVGLIGAVVTHPSWRGNGLASRLIQEVTSSLEEQGSSAIFLWTQEYELYKKQGYHPCGIQGRLPLSEIVKPSSSPRVQSGWRPDLFEMIRHRPGGLALEPTDQLWFEKQSSVDWRWIADRNNRVIAYAAAGRGMDLRGIVHDYLGEESELKEIFSQILIEAPSSELLYHPTYLPSEDFDPREGKVEYLCVAKVTKPGQLIESLAGVDCKVSRTEMGDFELQTAEAEAAGLRGKDLSRVLFGPDSPIFLGEGLLPLPLWFWGLDSA